MGHPVSARLEGYCLSLVLIDSCKMAFLNFFSHYAKERNTELRRAWGKSYDMQTEVERNEHYAMRKSYKQVRKGDQTIHLT